MMPTERNQIMAKIFVLTGRIQACELTAGELHARIEQDQEIIKGLKEQLGISETTTE